MVITPLYPFLVSLVFHIFGSNMLVFHICNVFLMLVLIYFIYKLIDNKIYLLGIIALFFSNSVTFPSYNLFILFLLVLIIYLEKKDGNDYLIGFLIGCSVLTKQSIGVFLLLPSLYYFKDKNKLLKRFIGFIIPCFVFLIYLIGQGNLYGFLDLCLFGLFDFGEKNNPVSWLGYIAFAIYIGIVIYCIIKDKKNLYNYYALAFSTMMIPLLDVHHCALAYIALIIVLFMNHEFSIKINLALVLTVCFVAITGISICKYNDGFDIIYPNDINHFEYRFIRSDSIEFTHNVLNYMNENKDRDFVFLTSGAYYYRLVTDTPITYLDLTNNGNYGYNGSDKIIKDIKKRKYDIFFVFEEELGDYCQSDKPSMKYVINNAKKTGSIQIYSIYEFK